jgi:hypothetical protein
MNSRVAAILQRHLDASQPEPPIVFSRPFGSVLPTLFPPPPLPPVSSLSSTIKHPESPVKSKTLEDPTQLFTNIICDHPSKDWLDLAGKIGGSVDIISGLMNGAIECLASLKVGVEKSVSILDNVTNFFDQTTLTQDILPKLGNRNPQVAELFQKRLQETSIDIVPKALITSGILPFGDLKKTVREEYEAQRKVAHELLASKFNGNAMAMIEDAKKTKDEAIFLRVLGLIGDKLGQEEWTVALNSFKRT